MFLCSSLSQAQSLDRFHICYTCVSIRSANGKDQTNHHFCQKNNKKKINHHRQSTKVKGFVLCRVDINSKPLEKFTYQLDEVKCCISLNNPALLSVSNKQFMNKTMLIDSYIEFNKQTSAKGNLLSPRNNFENFWISEYALEPMSDAPLDLLPPLCPSVSCLLSTIERISLIFDS